MITLSAANQANIGNRDLTPARIFRLPNVTHADGSPVQFSLGDVDGYEGGLREIGPIVRRLKDKRGGLAIVENTYVKLDMAAIEGVLQDAAIYLQGEDAEIIVKYGSDADIPRFSGKVDLGNSKFDGDGIYHMALSGDRGLKHVSAPDQQINATNFSSYDIPDEADGEWVPLTIGAPYRPKGMLVDTRQSPRWIFNKSISGHAGIGAVATDGYHHFVGGIYVPSGSTYTGAEAGNEYSSGIFIFTGPTAVINGRYDAIPLSAAWTGTAGVGANAEDAIDNNTLTGATLTDPAGDGVTAGDTFRMQLPDMGWPTGYRVSNLYIVGKIQKTQYMNNGARTVEQFHGGLELEDGVDPSGTELVQLLANGAQTWEDFTNGKLLTLSVYGTELRDKATAPASNFRFPVNRLSRRFMTIICTEEDLAGGGDTPEIFTILEAWLHIDFDAPVNIVNFHGDLSGYDDDSSGTYTGTSNALIESPVDVAYFLLSKIFAQSGFHTSSISASRTDYGTSKIGFQELEPVDAEALIHDIAMQTRLIVWRDYEGNFKFNRYDIPSSQDKTFTQDDGDFMAIPTFKETGAEDIINQFDFPYEWDAARNKYNEVESIDESTAGAIGTWLTASQSNYGVTRKKTVPLPYVCDANTQQSIRNWWIYQYADPKRLGPAVLGLYAADIEIADVVGFDHEALDRTAKGGSDDHDYFVWGVTDDLMNLTITLDVIQADVPYAALTDPT